jgi:hypothetical protein
MSAAEALLLLLLFAAAAALGWFSPAGVVRGASPAARGI